MLNKKNIRFILSVFILVSFTIAIFVALAVSSGIIDLSSDPVIHAEQNTTGVPVATASEHPKIDGKELELLIYERVNDRRKAHGSDPLVHSERVRLIARLHSADMAERDFFNHTNPDGINPRGRHNMYEGCEMPNENIAMWQNYPTNNTSAMAEDIVSGWADSPGHNKSMLTSYDKVTGVGVHVTENRTIYATQNFCREHPNA